jgi:hypothetical protein
MMWKNWRFSRLNFNRRGWYLLFLPLILGAMALGVRAAGPPQMAPSAAGMTTRPGSIIATDAGGAGLGLDSDNPLASVGTTSWSIHFFAVPGADGTSLFVSTGRTTQLDTSVTAEARVVGQAWHRHGMTYNLEKEAYETLISGIFTPGHSTIEGNIGLSTDSDNGDALETPDVPFRRFYVPTTDADPIVSVDNNLEMTLSDHSLPADAYVLVMSANTIPGPLPPGHQLVGQPYSVRASGATVTSTKPMLLKLFYTDTALGGVDPHTLSVLQWNPVSQEWDDLGGSLDDAIEHSVSTTTERFTVYALMATTRWRDVFNDFTGLSEWDHVTVLLPNGELVLDGLSYTGTATSRAITPTVSIEEWGHITFTRTVPVGTSLTVDVLGADDTPLLSDVTSGMSLTAVDPTVYPSLKLRATFTTTDLADSASLDKWTVTWEPRSCKVYLPIIVRQ